MTHETGFLDRTLTHAGKTYRYVVYIPADYDASRRWPVITFLHGAGERGSDGLRQSEVGLGRAIRFNPERFPALAIFPQAPEDTRWLGGEADFAMAATDRVIRDFNGDPDRVYLTGLSMGGYGVWHFALAYPGRFAALVPICGGVVKPATAESVRRSPLTSDAPDPYAFIAAHVKDVPVWIFHGADDATIPVSESRRMKEELDKVGASARYTEYPRVGHNAWDPAYGEAELWKWLFAQRRPSSSR